MQKHFLKFSKVFTNITFFPLILISNNSELAAKYLPNDVDPSISTFEMQKINNDLFLGLFNNEDICDKATEYKNDSFDLIWSNFSDLKWELFIY